MTYLERVLGSRGTVLFGRFPWPRPRGSCDPSRPVIGRAAATCGFGSALRIRSPKARKPPATQALPRHQSTTQTPSDPLLPQYDCHTDCLDCLLTSFCPQLLPPPLQQHKCLLPGIPRYSHRRSARPVCTAQPVSYT